MSILLLVWPKSGAQFANCCSLLRSHFELFKLSSFQTAKQGALTKKKHILTWQVRSLPVSIKCSTISQQLLHGNIPCKGNIVDCKDSMYTLAAPTRACRDAGCQHVPALLHNLFICTVGCQQKEVVHCRRFQPLVLDVRCHLFLRATESRPLLQDGLPGVPQGSDQSRLLICEAGVLNLQKVQHIWNWRDSCPLPQGRARVVALHNCFLQCGDCSCQVRSFQERSLGI